MKTDSNITTGSTMVFSSILNLVVFMLRMLQQRSEKDMGLTNTP